MPHKSTILGLCMLCAGALIAHADSLVILHTNDTHSQIDPTADDLGGVSRRKALVDSVRAAADNVLLIDCGDIVQGTLFFNIYKGEVEERLMNALGYDMRILGNHEFDNGLEALADNLSMADAELLASNYQTRGTALDGLFIPYTTREYGGRRIAFMPINLQPKGMIAERNYEGMGYVDAIETANAMAWYLKNIEQADMVIALTHIGYTANVPPSDQQLIAASRDIDVVIGGHSHTTVDPADPKGPAHIIKNADGRDVLVAQTGRYGQNVGEITIDLDNITALPKSRLIRVDSRWDDRLDPTIETLIAPYRAAVDSLNTTPLAQTARALPKSSDALLNYISDFTAHRGRQLADGVDFAIVNKGGLRNDLPKGTITQGQVITLVPFFNTIEVIDVEGSRLLDVFEVMARQGGQGVSDEVRATFDPQTGKCLSATLNGEPIRADRTYRIATNDYLSHGGDYMEGLADHTLVARSPGYIFDDLTDYIRQSKKPINPTDEQRFAPVVQNASKTLKNSKALKALKP